MTDKNENNQDNWTTRITAAGSILGPVLMILVLYFQNEAKKASDEAAEHAKEAKVATTALKKETKEQFNDIAIKQDANLKNWKAYNTKDPEDMDQAHKAIIMAEQQPPPSPSKKEG
jgi:hypothetical protein